MRPYRNKSNENKPAYFFSGTPRLLQKFAGAVLLALLMAAFVAGVSHSRDEIGRLESESLGLIIKYIEMVEDKPLLAAIFNVKTGKTVEYTIGDYIEGMLVRDILEDRVVLYDEITRHQFVLIFNDVVSAAEEDEQREATVIRIKEKKRDIEEMNVTNIFNNELNRVQGKEPLKFGAPDAHQAQEAAQKMNRYIRDFKANTDGFKNTPERPSDADAQLDTNETATAGSAAAGSVEVGVREKTPADKGTDEIGVSGPSSSPAKTSGGTGDTKPVELPTGKTSPDLKSTGETALKRPQPGKPAMPEAAGEKGASAPVRKTHDGTTVKIREKANKAPSGDILEDK